MIAASKATSGLFVWSLVLVAVVLVGFVLVVWVKRRLREPDVPPISMGFSLADLRELHRTGKISNEEYERARGRMAASLKRKEAGEKPKKPE